MKTLIAGGVAALALALSLVRFDPTGLRRGTRLRDCRWQECRRGPGFQRPVQMRRDFGSEATE